MSSLPILGHEPCKEVIIDDKTLFSGELACSDFVVIISKFWLCVNAFFFRGVGVERKAIVSDKYLGRRDIQKRMSSRQLDILD